MACAHTLVAFGWLTAHNHDALHKIAQPESLAVPTLRRFKAHGKQFHLCLMLQRDQRVRGFPGLL